MLLTFCAFSPDLFTEDAACPKQQKLDNTKKKKKKGRHPIKGFKNNFDPFREVLLLGLGWETLILKFTYLCC